MLAATAVTCVFSALMPSTFITKFWNNQCRPWLIRQVVAVTGWWAFCVCPWYYISDRRAHTSKSGQKVDSLCTCNSLRLADVACLGSWKRAQGPPHGVVSLRVNCLRLSLCWDAGERHWHSLAAEHVDSYAILVDGGCATVEHLSVTSITICVLYLNRRISRRWVLVSMTVLSSVVCRPTQ